MISYFIIFSSIATLFYVSDGHLNASNVVLRENEFVYSRQRSFSSFVRNIMVHFGKFIYAYCFVYVIGMELN